MTALDNKINKAKNFYTFQWKKSGNSLITHILYFQAERVL
ncbi:hypothetical protein X953_00045 [Virgibacillus sp. SK37]|nr:hypothetical protein X953_00045 [Virgibacillus sp. SK37]